MVLASVAFEVKVRLQLRSMLIFFVFIRLLIESLRSPINNGSGGYLYGTGGLGFHLRDPSARLSYASTRPSGPWWLGYVPTLLNQRGTYLNWLWQGFCHHTLCSHGIFGCLPSPAPLRWAARPTGRFVLD